MNVAQRLYELRKNAKKSQEEVAEQLGVSRQTISKWESDHANPNLNNVVQIQEMSKANDTQNHNRDILMKALIFILVFGAVSLIGYLVILGLCLI